jgi:hypothetical protein
MSAVVGLLWIGSGILVPTSLAPHTERFQTFVTIFLGIFIEALPFLLAGVLVSSAIHLFMTPERLQRLLPRSSVASALAGSLLGLVFPVCECGSVPAARRLLSKGAPLPLGIAFVLASPVVNPIVIVSTAVAFGSIFGWEFVAWRVGLTIVIAMIVGLVIGTMAAPENILVRGVLAAVPSPGHDHDHEHNHEHDHHGHHHDHSDSLLANESRTRRVLTHAGEEFFEMSRFLVIGGLLAAGLQTFISPSLLLSLGGGPTLSVLVMMLLAVVLSICSTVDSFVALSFVGTFAPGALLAFLVFGPMVDIKSSLMFTSTFQRRTVAYMIVLIALLVASSTILINNYG